MDKYNDEWYTDKLKQWSTELMARDMRKAKDYMATNEEYRFQAFEDAVSILKLLGTIDTPAKVAYCFATKHLVRLAMMLRSPERHSQKDIDEVCGDIVAYMNLDRGMLYERSGLI